MLRQGRTEKVEGGGETNILVNVAAIEEGERGVTVQERDEVVMEEEIRKTQELRVFQSHALFHRQRPHHQYPHSCITAS